MGHSIAMAMALTDAELLEASRRGEHAAFGTLVERYQDLVAAVSYSRTRDQALSEDVAQETFLVAWRQLDQLREPGRLRAWLCGIARNLASKARRRTVREAPVDAPLAVADENPFDDVCEAQAERVVGEALARVPESYRDVLVLYYREQRSARDVAKALGISEAAALQRLARGRQYLADGVTALVEKSLASPRLRRNIAASVVAALPVIGVSRVEAATSSHGGSMFKLAIAAAVVAAAGTTALVVHRKSADDTPAAAVSSHVASAPSAAIDPHTTGPRHALVPTPQPTMPAVKAQPGDGKYVTPAPETVASVDRATSERLGLEKGPARGPTNAPVTIVMFTDLQCRHCQNVEGSIDQLMDEYPSKVRLVIKQLPVHKTAVLAAEASYAADAQGKFWELHEQMLANHEDLSQPALEKLAREAGLDVGNFKAALDAHTYVGALDADRAAAAELELTGTPSFVINGRKVIGNLPMAELRKVLNAALTD